MARPYTSRQYLDLVEKIRKAFKTHRTGMESTIALSTDVIVGFPGETEENFLNTAKLFKKVGFDMAYIACYSRREGTAAATLQDNVPKVEKDRRYRELTRIMMETSLENNSKYVGQILPVLIEKILEKNGTWAVGKTRSYKTVKFPFKPDSRFLPGDIAMVSITKALPLGLTAQPL
jgi:tRNA-2-methylthio-N6-dimethylallyladenosine synthase